MVKTHDIVVFPGDYGGPEVMAEGLKVHCPRNQWSVREATGLIVKYLRF